MSKQTLNSCLKDAPGYWNPFTFLTEMREQRVVVDNSKQMVPTYIAIVFHEGAIKFFRINRRLVLKIREICPTGNITDYLWQVRALRKDRTPFFTYEVRGTQISNFDNFFEGLDKEALIAEANTMLESIPDVVPRLEQVIDANGREIEPEISVVPVDTASDTASEISEKKEPINPIGRKIIED